MTIPSVLIAAIFVSCIAGVAHAAPNATFASDKLGTRVPKAEAKLSAYRQYVKEQADTLVGMTRVLASAVKHDDLDASQMSYAPAHRYLKRIVPITRALPDLDNRMDARADAYEKKEADPAFSGFHRIEYGLFTNRSTSSLSDYADRLNKDARELRERLAVLDVTPATLVDGVIRNLEDIADRGLAGDEERYSRTDLWDLEANVDGARQVAAIFQSQPQNARTVASTEIHFAEINALLEKHKVGCGFKTYDELTQKDRMALKAPIAALVEDFSTLRGTLAIN